MSDAHDITKGAIETVVLQTLSELKEAYGYQLLQAMREANHEILSFQEGTLYPLLYRLEARKFVESEEKEGTGKKARRYYRLTTQGQTYLKLRREQYAKLYAELKTSLHFSV